jgi:hypothetical protein
MANIFFLLLLRVSASVFSVKFRVRPWLMLLLILGLISVANASAYSSALPMLAMRL